MARHMMKVIEVRNAPDWSQHGGEEEDLAT